MEISDNFYNIIFDKLYVNYEILDKTCNEYLLKQEIKLLIV